MTRKKADKKASQKKAKRTGRISASGGAFSFADESGAGKRKRKRSAVADPGDSASLPSTSSFVMERYNPKTTFASFQQGVKMLNAFLNMCHSTDSASDNHISESVRNIVNMQVGLLESLMTTLQEHIR